MKRMPCVLPVLEGEVWADLLVYSQPVHTHTHSYTYTHSHTLIYIHTHTHTHSHTHTPLWHTDSRPTSGESRSPSGTLAQQLPLLVK